MSWRAMTGGASIAVSRYVDLTLYRSVCVVLRSISAEEPLNPAQMALLKPLIGDSWVDEASKEPVLTWGDLFDLSSYVQPPVS